jgi:hypothetical protein
MVAAGVAIVFARTQRNAFAHPSYEQEFINE